MNRPAAAWRSTAALAMLAWSAALLSPAPAQASAVCPPPPDDLAGLIAVDATIPGPLTEEFRPVHGSYSESAAACWGGATLTYVGFVAGPQGIGGTTEFVIEPAWMVSRAHWLAATSQVDPDAGPIGPFLAIAVPPPLEDDVLALTASWVKVSGQFDDPVARSCIVTEGSPEPGVVPTPTQTVEICRTSFVLTSVTAWTLPPTDTAFVLPSTGRNGAAPLVVALVAGATLLISTRRSRPPVRSR